MALYDPDPEWETRAEQRAEAERDWFADDASDQCCPRDIPVPTPDGGTKPGCTCPRFCECMCLSCACTEWGEEVLY